MYPQLSEFFLGAAGKRLSAVEADPVRSHQHEFNGAKPLVGLLGEPIVHDRYPARFVYIDDDLTTTVADGRLTWYETRAGERQRAREAGQGRLRREYRLYYPSNAAMDLASPDDYMVLARATDGSLVVIVSPGASSVTEQLRTMFALEDSTIFSISAEPRDVDLSFTAASILEALGYEVPLADDNLLDGLLAAFGGGFPSTAVFSAHARSQTGIGPMEGPDAAIVAWMRHEEILFRTLEHHIVSAELSEAGDDVDHVLQIAQRTFQRRKARAGQALENHMQAILDARHIPYTRGGVTEGSKKPDFLFPGVNHYRDSDFPSQRLRMLGVKTTCKDRWRQVLSEADRIPYKHLLTLEAPISTTQLDEMQASQLALVVPEPLHNEFTPPARPRIMTLASLLIDVGGLA